MSRDTYNMKLCPSSDHKEGFVTKQNSSLGNREDGPAALKDIGATFSQIFPSNDIPFNLTVL